MNQNKQVDVIRPRSLRAIIGPSGTLRRIIENKNYFLQKGYDFEIFTHDNINHGTNLPNVTSTVTKSKSFRFKVATRLRALAKRSYFLSVLYTIKEYKHVERLVKYYMNLNRKPDIVAFHSVFECYQFLKRNNKEFKVICFFHSEGIPFKMTLFSFPKLKNSKFYSKLYEMEKYVGEKADRLIFITNIGQSNFLKYHPNISREKTTVILNGIDDHSKSKQRIMNSLDNWTNARYHLCCVGTITNRKGQRIIVEALNRMDKSKMKDIFVTFIGEGAERIPLEHYVKENDLARHVKFFGAVDNTKVYEYLQKASIFILMSNNEGLPISIIEAMREGLPIISTRISGIPELVSEKENGLLIEPDVEQLTHIFNHMHDYNWEEMGRNSRKRFVSEFTFKRMAKEYCDVLDTLN